MANYVKSAKSNLVANLKKSQVSWTRELLQNSYIASPKTDKANRKFFVLDVYEVVNLTAINASSSRASSQMIQQDRGAMKGIFLEIITIAYRQLQFTCRKRVQHLLVSFILDVTCDGQ